MIKRLLNVALSLILLLSSAVTELKAQCPGGWTTAQTNWDWLDYLVSNGSYAPTSNWPGVPVTLAATQAFAIGTNRFTIAYAGGIACTLGENITNTAEAGSFGAGADVQYANNGTITITFDTLVKNVQFSLYDIDINQTARVTADDGVAALVINMNVVTAGNIVVVGSPGIGPLATANAIADANNDTKGTLNISIPGGGTGVKKIIITIGGTAGDFWLSDITACVNKTFATNYFIDAKPFTGQATYILATPDSNSVSYIDTATGNAKFLFSGNLAADANTPVFLNGLAYDHRKHYLYYVHDFGNKAYNTRTLRRWDYNTEAIDVSLAVDVNTLGIPTFDGGVESGGSSFYDGALYFGVEGNNSSNNSGRESIIWRIDFDASNNPVKSCQVWATPADDGAGTRLHDWNDFVMRDGILFNFDGAGSTAQDDYYHFNMQTGVMLQDYTTAASNDAPRQAAITWAGNVYWVYDSIGVYNGSGGVGPKRKIKGRTPANFFPDWAVGTIIGSTKGASGDAAGPFKTKTDFGDAPASYDPATSDPATHEMDSTIRIGPAEDREFSKKGVTAIEDTDDGITSLSIFDPGTLTYLVQVKVYNHTGAPATLIAWFDYNGNGVFDASEAITPITVNSSVSLQSFWLWWPVILSPLPNGSYTYLRIRLTSASNGMTTSNPTGYYNNGEVEDYKVLVDHFPLAINLLTFDAVAENNKTVKLTWQANEDAGLITYEIERSPDSRNWQHISFVEPAGAGRLNNYESRDNQPLAGTSYYRLKMINSGSVKFSNIKAVTIKGSATDVVITPNPASNTARISLQRSTAAEATIRVTTLQGGTIYTTTVIINGNTIIDLPAYQWPAAIYIVQVITNDEVVNKKLIINK
jgi:GEVED domain/Secretion system C-terminal sorting domain